MSLIVKMILQVEDGSAGEQQEDDDNEEDTSVPDELFLRIEPRTKIERKWKPEIDVRATNYSRPIQPSHINNVPRGRWATIPHGELFMMQLTEGEIELWARLTSINLKKRKEK
jgi:hypothetical protein